MAAAAAAFADPSTRADGLCRVKVHTTQCTERKKLRRHRIAWPAKPILVSAKRGQRLLNFPCCPWLSLGPIRQLRFRDCPTATARSAQIGQKRVLTVARGRALVEGRRRRSIHAPVTIERLAHKSTTPRVSSCCNLLYVWTGISAQGRQCRDSCLRRGAPAMFMIRNILTAAALLDPCLLVDPHTMALQVRAQYTTVRPLRSHCTRTLSVDRQALRRPTNAAWLRALDCGVPDDHADIGMVRLVLIVSFSLQLLGLRAEFIFFEKSERRGERKRLHRKKLACHPAEQQRRGVSLRRPRLASLCSLCTATELLIFVIAFRSHRHPLFRSAPDPDAGHPWRRLQLDKSPHPPSGERDGTRQMCFHFLPRYVQTSLSATDGSRRS